jgi:hypothetical protein
MFKSVNELTLGTDPEVFPSINDGGKNLVISPALLEKFSGLREIRDQRPEEEQLKHPFYIKHNDYNWMMDGVAMEATIKPSKTPTEMYDKLQNALDMLDSRLFGLNFKGSPVFSVKKPVIAIEPDMYLPYLDEEKIMQGFIFGCDPDEDAILPDYECEELDVTSHPFRYGGGHFHIGSENAEIAEVMQKLYKPFMRLLAIFVGNACIAYSDYPEEEKQRAETYGKPGRFRFQKWGIEYRSPSNSWISNLDTIRLMFEGAEKSVTLLQKPKDGMQVINKYLEPTIKAILNGDRDVSHSIIEEVL